jgi:serine/threonine protein kinase
LKKKLLRSILLISVADTKGVSQLIESENKSNNLTQRRLNNENLWMIMERASGYSLKEFIEQNKRQRVLEVSEAIQLTLNLMRIIQQVHNKRIFHQNLSPENIIIDWDLKSSIDRAQLVVLNFSQAVIVSGGLNRSAASSTQKWYNAPQTNEKRFSSTVDSSGICAVLFWLLTLIDPRHENDNLPHQLGRNKLIDMLGTVKKSTGM